MSPDASRGEAGPADWSALSVARVAVPEGLAHDAVDGSEVVPIASGSEVELQQFDAATGLDHGGGDGLGNPVSGVSEIKLGGIRGTTRLSTPDVTPRAEPRDHLH